MVRRLSDELAKLSISRPLVVTDCGVREAGLVDKVVDGRHEQVSTIYDGTPGNPNPATARHFLLGIIQSSVTTAVASVVASCRLADGPFAEILARVVIDLFGGHGVDRPFCRAVRIQRVTLLPSHDEHQSCSLAGFR